MLIRMSDFPQIRDAKLFFELNHIMAVLLRWPVIPCAPSWGERRASHSKAEDRSDGIGSTALTFCFAAFLQSQQMILSASGTL